MANLLFLNGRDLSVTYGLSMTGLPDIYSAPATPWDTLDVPRRPGTILRNDTPTPAPRPFTLSGIIVGANATDAVDKLTTLKRDVVGQVVRLAFDPVTGIPAGRGADAVVERITGTFFSGQINNTIAITMALLLYDAVLTDDAVTTVTATPPAPVSIDVGSAPTIPVVTIDGPAVDPILVYTDAFGIELGRMEFGVTLGSGDTLTIDSRDGGSVIYAPGGIPENGMRLIVNDGFTFPVLRPQDAQPPILPTLAASTGATITAAYRRQYY